MRQDRRNERKVNIGTDPKFSLSTKESLLLTESLVLKWRLNVVKSPGEKIDTELIGLH